MKHEHPVGVPRHVLIELCRIEIPVSLHTSSCVIFVLIELCRIEMRCYEQYGRYSPLS